jgi:hypothetical protein
LSAVSVAGIEAISYSSQFAAKAVWETNAEARAAMEAEAKVRCGRASGIISRIGGFHFGKSTIPFRLQLASIQSGGRRRPPFEDETDLFGFCRGKPAV